MREIARMLGERTDRHGCVGVCAGDRGCERLCDNCVPLIDGAGERKDCMKIEFVHRMYISFQNERAFIPLLQIALFGSCSGSNSASQAGDPRRFLA